MTNKESGNWHIEPTLFFNSKEVEEAVKYGYLNCAQGTNMGYETGGGNAKGFPTMFWGGGENDRPNHQPMMSGNTCAWNTKERMTLLGMSSTWHIIREQHKPKEWYEKQNAFPRLCWVWDSNSNKSVAMHVVEIKDYKYKFRAKNGSIWLNAEPITEDELKCIME